MIFINMLINIYYINIIVISPIFLYERSFIMENAWLIRPFPHGKERLSEFLERGIIAVGWPKIGDLTGKSRGELKEILSGPPYNYNGLRLGNAYASIDILVNQMHIGDLLLLPDNDDIYFGEITSEYYYDPSTDNDEDGYPHQRKIKWLTTIPISRQSLSRDLRYSLKVRRTTANFSHHYAEIDALSHGRKFVASSISSEESVTLAAPASSTDAVENTNMIQISYPLRPDCMVTARIPKDINEQEAKRLGMYFSSLYFAE